MSPEEIAALVAILLPLLERLVALLVRLLEQSFDTEPKP